MPVSTAIHPSGASLGKVFFEPGLAKSLSDIQLRQLTIRVNDICNFSCPHCYTHFASPDKQKHTLINIGLVCDFLEKYKPEIVSVVAEEPLLNKEVRAATLAIGQFAIGHGAKFHFITNGMGFADLQDEYDAGLLKQVISRIDFSVDCVGEAFNNYRAGGNRHAWEKVSLGIKQAESLLGADQIKVLTTVNSMTLPGLNNTLDYFATHHSGICVYLQPTVEAFRREVGYGDILISLDDFLNEISHYAQHSCQWKFILDNIHLGGLHTQDTGFEGDEQDLSNLLESLGLFGNVVYVPDVTSAAICRLEPKGNDLWVRSSSSALNSSL